MALQDMINSFQSILNRDDCTATQAQSFVMQGVGRVQRECRLPCMERQVLVNPTGAVSWVDVPNDLIEIIDVIVTDVDGTPKALRKLPYRELIRVDANDRPWCYARYQSQIFIAGTLPAPDASVGWSPTIRVLYYGQFTPFAGLSAENELSASAPDLAVYAALSYAADTFRNDSKADWENTYQQIKGEVQGMAIDLEMNGGPAVVQPLYCWEG